MTDPARREQAFAAALRAHAQGDLAAAALGYEDLLRDAPHDARVLARLGVLRMQQKRLEDAEALLDRALALDAGAAEPYSWRGEVLRQRGRTREAIADLRAALALSPALAPAWFNLGLAHEEAGEHADARTAWLAFLGARPGDARVRRELGRLAYERRDYAEAADWFAQQLAAFSADVDAACDLATVHLARRAHAQAAEVLAPTLALQRPAPRAIRLHAQALIAQGRAAEALAPLRNLMAVAPRDAEATYQAGRACDALARLDEAIEWFAKAAALAPDRAEVRNALAVAHLNLGDHAEAVEQFTRAVELRPTYHEAHSNLLMTLHYLPGLDAAEVLAEHQRWARQHADVPPRPRAAFADPRGKIGAPGRGDTRIRIGYVSPRFCGGPLMRFFLPLLAAHDHRRFHVTCYAVSDLRDAATDAMRAHADRWVECASMDDDALTSAIRADGVDILVDLVGHCPGNRLGVFARRAAAIQVTWMDYVDTTALPAMDYVLSDEGHTPAGGAQVFSETVVRLPDTRLCYLPIDPLPPLAPPPRLARGHVTFGCFNRLSKFGADVIATWAEILRNVEGSRLILKSTAFAAESTRATIGRRFATHAIAPGRLDLRPFSEERAMMADYGEVDIALDPFPYNGCTTTCDALAMGVPVVTLEGRTLPGRHGVALLGACGMHEWVAGSREAYVALATRAAADVDTLSRLRTTLRPRFLASALCDAPRFARAVEAAYVAMIEAPPDAG